MSELFKSENRIEIERKFKSHIEDFLYKFSCEHPEEEHENILLPLLVAFSSCLAEHDALSNDFPLFDLAKEATAIGIYEMQLKNEKLLDENILLVQVLKKNNLIQ